ncbi:hypothetical protein P175DRAFT_0492476 [Aspergillus ochraceoroseus IBT 24754]|uniref:C2H2-type domain-containing protein n=1 Tax=Aspergillus ochraceoroseus IBT 24754 TaxID=1392256 RepID=A0A2T5LZZ3_9EURO|nr:uncharacterized protein P175DRAFT_0492476 [Aspergillus ochraceoroseus IBT 24754]PTU21857.1 hypothetical protein P175DRAFT_0492476 [Aspergillus ochraceoroseus IBT 24754]
MSRRHPQGSGLIKQDAGRSPCDQSFAQPFQKQASPEISIDNPRVYLSLASAAGLNQQGICGNLFDQSFAQHAQQVAPARFDSFSVVGDGDASPYLSQSGFLGPNPPVDSQAISLYSPVGPASLSQQRWQKLVRVKEIIIADSSHYTQDPQGFDILKPCFSEAVEIIEHLLSPEQEEEKGEEEQVSQDGNRGNTNLFRCFLCDERKRTDYTNRGTFSRHITTDHAQRFEFTCRLCHFTSRRRDKLHNHMRGAHSGHGPLTKEEIKANSTQLSPPTFCLFCGTPVDSWKSLLNCLCSHCALTQNGHRQRQDGDDRNDGNGGRDDGSGGAQFPPSDSSGMRGSQGTSGGEN